MNADKKSLVMNGLGLDEKKVIRFAGGLKAYSF